MSSKRERFVVELTSDGYTLIDYRYGEILNFDSYKDASNARIFAIAYERRWGDINFDSFPYSLDDPFLGPPKGFPWLKSVPNPSNEERRLWVLNDEGLYNLHRRSGLPMKVFIKRWRDTIDDVINNVISGRKQAHYLEYDRSIPKGKQNPNDDPVTLAWKLWVEDPTQPHPGRRELVVQVINAMHWVYGRWESYNVAITHAKFSGVVPSKENELIQEAATFCQQLNWDVKAIRKALR